MVSPVGSVTRRVVEEITTPSAEAAATPPKTGGETEVAPSAEAAATPPKTGGELSTVFPPA